MISKIRILPEDVINKVAAGEVIENTASVVKELVENSLDAGSTEITVEIKSGGRQLIRITDNGCGMSQDDALLSLERHGTSKIRNIEDLQEILTMGFRGEAIPSIASISKLTMITCERPSSSTDQKKGTMIVVEGGRIIKCSPAERVFGTTIEIQSLFYNIPVRLKYQKSPSYDTNEIMKAVSLLALGYPHIQFKLIADNKTLLSCKSITGDSLEENIKGRIPEVLGTEFAALTLPLYYENSPYKIFGIIGLPSFTRNNRTGQYLFLNHRAIHSPLISYAVREGYSTMIPTQKYPVFVLHLFIPPSLIDVNVHPQKKEVRLREEYAVKKAVTEAVTSALQSTVCEQRSSEFEGLQTNQSPFSSYFPWNERKWDERKWDQSKPNEEEMINVTTSENEISSWMPLEKEISKQVYLSPKNLQVTNKTYSESSFFDLTIPSLEPKVVATIPGYIFVENVSSENECAIIDQYRAHQRILFERYVNEKKIGEQKTEVEMLLIPYTFTLTFQESKLLDEHLSTLNLLGLGIREFGQHTYVLDAIPTYLKEKKIEELMAQLLDEIQSFQSVDCLEREKNRRAILLVKRLAISRSKKLVLSEANKIVSELFQCTSPLQCPSGKKIVKILNSEEIAKLFLN